MRRSGLQLLLSSMGIDINPDEVKQKYEETKNIMPKLAAFVNTLDARLTRIELHLGVLDTRLYADCEHGLKLRDCVTCKEISYVNNGNSSIRTG